MERRNAESSVPVSVIIPTFNRANLLKDAVESVLMQTRRCGEVIIVDDGSTDDTAGLIKSLRGSGCVSAVSIPHSGVSRARNTGIKKARGAWIAFLDSDDIWLPSKIEKQLEYLEQHPEFLVCHTDEIWLKNGKMINQGKKHAKCEGWFFIPSLDLCLISPSTVLIHRCVLEKVGLFDESFEYVEDYELWLRITSRYPIGFVNEKLTLKRGGHPDQLSKKIDGIEKYRMAALEKLMLANDLPVMFLEEALKTFRKKCGIYAEGCEKRGRYEEAEAFRARLNGLMSRFKAQSPRVLTAAASNNYDKHTDH